MKWGAQYNALLEQRRAEREEAAKKPELPAHKKKKKQKYETEYMRQQRAYEQEYLRLREQREQEEREREQERASERIAARTSGNSEKEERTWFNSGLFKDGYQFGDITKTILGSAADVGENVGSGILGMGEKIVDTAAFLAPMAENAQFYQNGGIYTLEQQRAHEEAVEQSKTELQKFIQKDLYNEEQVAKKIVGGITGGYDYEASSVFGEKSDSLIQSGGQLLGTMGLQAVGVPWFLTTGATSFGSEAENALNQGADWEEAGMSAAISAGAEILSEKLSGGISFGGKTLDEAATKFLGRTISNKLGRTLAKLGMDMVGEGAEEVFSQVASNLGSALYKEESLDEILFSEEAFDGYLESFIGGTVLGGVSSGYKAVTSNTDYVTELTENEQKVVDKVYKDRLAEQKPKTEKEKARIYDQVLRDLEKGYISTDTIEEVLGGESYKGYQKAVEYEDSILKEYDELGQKQNATLAEQARYNELSGKVQDMKKFDWRKNAKSRLSQEVSSLVQSDRLLESYNERSRRGQTFTADLSRYDAKQQAVIQKAIDSGILNDTNRTHEFVDMVAKISADKGVLFDFTNNAKLKDSGFAVDGKTVNGYVTKEGVTVNIDSAKSMNSIVGHEITHVLEGTEFYDVLQKTVIEYAKAKGDYQGRYDALSKLYENIKDANVDNELTADLVGDYLFSDSDFINRLSTEHRNVFQKIYDEIKYLCKVATAGSKEARELERVKKAFEDAYRAEGNVTGTKYSVSDKNIKDISTDYAYGETYYTMSYTQDGKVVAKLEYGEYDGEPNVKMIEVQPEYRRKGIATKLMQELQRKYPDTEINFGMSTPDGTKLLDSITYDVTDEAVVADRQKLKALQAELNDLQEKLDVLYDTDPLTEEQDAELHRLGDRWQEVYETIHDLSENLRGKKATRTFVKTDAKYSISDSDGKELTKEQQEYFKDSKMRDENGNLKVMYHGSQDAGFHVFNAEMSDDGTSFFFVDRNDVAASYSGTSETYEAKTIRSAEDMNNFLAEIGYDQYEAVEKDGKFELLENGDHVAWSDTAQGLYEEFCWYEGVGEGDVNYKVYLNLKNPLEVDAEGKNWNNLSREFSQEVYDRYKSLTDSEKTALAEIADWGEYSIFRTEILEMARAKGNGKYHDTDLASAYEKLGGANANLYDAFSIASDNFSEESLRQFAVKQMNTRDYAQKARSEGYDGVIFKNIVDNGGYSNGSEGASTVAIAFESNQIKSVANEKPTGDKDIRYSLTEYSVEEKKAHNKMVLDHFGKTYKWAEAGYVLLDGSRLDLSGKHDGAPGGYRSVDHRDIVDALGSDYGNGEYSGSLVQFMSEGNIRISPECNGINLSVKPNRAQEMALSDFISRARGEVLLDIDDFNGYTVVSVEYPRGTHANKVLGDIRGWFDNGTEPTVSSLGQFRSLSENGEAPKRRSGEVYGDDIALEVAPVSDNATDNTRNATDNATPVLPNAENATVSEVESVPEEEMFPDDLAPIESELERLIDEEKDIRGAMEAYAAVGDVESVNKLIPEHEALKEKIRELQNSENERADSLTDADAPPEEDARFPGESNEEYVENPFEDRDWYAMKSQKVKAYMYENPEVKPFFQEEAMNLLGEMNDGNQAETWYNDQLHYESGGEKGFGGIKRHMPKDIEEMLDSWHMRYDDIRKGLNAIIEDNGAENIAAAKKIEFMLNRRLLHGYESFYTKKRVPPNEAYLDLLYEKQINEYSEEAFAKLMENADQYAPAAPAKEDIAPVAPMPTETVKTNNVKGVVKGQQVMKSEYEAIKPKKQAEPRMARATPAEQARAEILTEEPEVEKKSPGAWAWVKNSILDKGMVFEDLSLATGNRELQARWNSIRYAEGKGQKLIGEGNASVRALKDIEQEVKSSGKLKTFYEYLYHMHNIDRMTLEQRFHDTPNKPVFGDSVTADISREEVAKLEKANPEFKKWAKDVWDYNKHLREMAVDGGLISREIADLWQTMYPHYVPVRRAGDTGLNVNVPLDTGRTGVNAPFKKAKGGSRDILPLFDTMGQRTLQTYRAISKNRFGVELKNTLRTTISQEASNVDEAIDSMDAELLQKGENGKKPTFTVFENGQKVTFEITDEMYNSMKPTSDMMHYTNKVANAVSNFRRGTLTEYNPWFMLKNAVKDVQDVLINSQHPGRTYAAIPKAIKHMLSNGHYYQEYMENGGEQNSYFDGQTNTFKEENKTLATAKKIFGLDAISKANNVIERLPRLAEYIASRESGASVDVAMLDAARVTTNFAAGGDVTKFFNRNGFTFLNASVQGAVQQARNIREAKMNGLKGWASLAAKYIAAGLPAVVLNHLIWDDDEEYAELSDYVKQDYYIVGKFGDGRFVRIPKGRTVAVIQNAFEQMENLITGNDEADLKTFLELAVSNLAPNNPLENNILSPIIQAANNETWYGEDLVPTRLQDLPAAEQYDETTDSISRWLGETFDISPYKANYLIDQYSGVLGDTFLPMLTPEAESGNNDLLAPLRDMFTTDSVLKNQNVSDFYDLKDELSITANGSNATDEDKLRAKYINSISASLSELYQQKREIQNSDMSDEEKYAEVRDIQQQIVDLMKEGMSSYQDISYEDDYRGGGEYARVADRVYKLTEDGEWQKLSDEQLTKYEVTKAAGDASYASDGTNHYRWYVKEGETQGEWVKITDKQLEKQREVTSALRVSPEDYWENKEEYDFAYESPDSYAVAKAVGGYEAYKKYSSELYDIKADKDEWGKSISGSRKEKVQAYINGLDADYWEKVILFKSEYTSYDDENYGIIEYLNNRDDISFEEMKSILLKLGFEVDNEGNIRW